MTGRPSTFTQDIADEERFAAALKLMAGKTSNEPIHGSGRVYRQIQEAIEREALRLSND